MQVTLLGTMGWMPSERRETTCTACRDGDDLLLFDAGTGLRRLLTPVGAALLDGVSRVHLFLSHYHLDHTCGLAYLPGVLPGRQIVLHPPAAELTGVDPGQAVAGLLRRPYNPRDWRISGRSAWCHWTRAATRWPATRSACGASSTRTRVCPGAWTTPSCRPPTRSPTPASSDSRQGSACCFTRHGTPPTSRIWTRCRRSCDPVSPPTATPAPSRASPPPPAFAASSSSTSTRCWTRRVSRPWPPTHGQCSRGTELRDDGERVDAGGV